MYYGIITVAVLMFSVQFWFNQIYEKECGGGMRSTVVFAVGSYSAGLAGLLIINGFRFEFTWFSLIMAILTAIDGIAYTFCSLKALGKINLSLYSVIAMLGGMMLPFLFGIFFYNEDFTVGKLVCVALVTASLFLTVRRGGKSSGKLYYAGIFILNGMSGVLAKIFQSAPYEKTSEAGFSVLSTGCAILLSAALLPFIKGEKLRPKNPLRAGIAMLGNGILNKIANFMLLIALAHVPASAQYPLVTGGVMIFSTIICFFTPDKPRKRDLAAVILSFLGILSLALLP